MIRAALQILFFSLAVSSFALNTAELVTDSAALEILQKKCIRLGTSELLPIRFSTAKTVLDNPELVTAAQGEFARSISSDGKVDFPIIENGPSRHYYINENGDRTDLVELYKKQSAPQVYDYIVMASGNRKFGDFDVIIHLKVIDAGNSGIVYSVNVHAWPHSWLARASHKIGLTRSYFRKKMKLISWVAREIATGLCEKEEIKIQLKAQ